MNGFIMSSLIITIMFLSYFLAKKYQIFRKILIIVYMLTTTVYIIWRIGWTLPYNNITSFIFGLLLIIAEVGGFVLSVIFYRLFFTKKKREEVTLDVYQGIYPTVDIFIATYNESEAILKRGIVAAKLADYPEKSLVNIYVCDDGSRQNIRELSRELGVHYVQRERHEHAKAGNLNHALTVSTGDLIVTMDADMVMRQDFLTKTIGYFNDPKMGFVQSPQTFFNQDPYQFNLFAGAKIGNDQDFFMRSIETQKDAVNAVMYVGSNAIFRRNTLADVGGFSTGVITEDMATGMFIQAAGWQSGFVNSNLASGLAPETFGDLIKQRDRWARGNIQVAKKWNPLKIRGLTLLQRILYVDGIHYWFSGIYKMIFLVAPLVFLLLGQYSLQANMHQLIIFWLPAFLASQLTFNMVAEKKQTVSLSNIYEIATAPFMAFAVFNELFLKSKKSFVVTRKGVNSDASYYNWGTAWPILLLLGLSIIALLRGIGILTGYLSSTVPIQGIYINVFWLCYNLIGLILASYLSNERPRLRQSERFASKQLGTILLSTQRISGQIIDWNENGARIKIDEPITADLDTEGKLIIDDVEIVFTTRWQKKINKNSQQQIIGVTFEHLNESAYNFIINQTYAKPSYLLNEVKYTNHIIHLIILYWVNKLKKHQSY